MDDASEARIRILERKLASAEGYIAALTTITLGRYYAMHDEDRAAAVPADHTRWERVAGEHVLNLLGDEVCEPFVEPLDGDRFDRAVARMTEQFHAALLGTPLEYSAKKNADE